MTRSSQAIVAGILALAAAGASHAHPGVHGADGAMATLVHLLSQHGWLPLLLTGAVLLAWRRRRTALARPRRRGEGG